jgi:hypothetical protein
MLEATLRLEERNDETLTRIAESALSQHAEAAE